MLYKWTKRGKEFLDLQLVNILMCLGTMRPIDAIIPMLKVNCVRE